MAEEREIQREVEKERRAMTGQNKTENRKQKEKNKAEVMKKGG